MLRRGLDVHTCVPGRGSVATCRRSLSMGCPWWLGGTLAALHLLWTLGICISSVDGCVLGNTP